MAKYFGVDMSKWQTGVNYEKLAKASIGGSKTKYAMLRIGASRVVDPLFPKHYNGCKDNGIYVGVYYYSTAKNLVEAKLEALWVIERLKHYEIDYPVAFDYEDKSLISLRLSADMYTQIAQEFMDTIREANYYPILYTNPDWLENRYNKSELLPKYDLWLAQYTADGKQKQYGQTMWQYGLADVGGVSGPCDVNECYVGYAKKIRELGMNKLITRYNVYGTKTVDDSNLAETEGLLKANGFTVSKKEV